MSDQTSSGLSERMQRLEQQLLLMRMWAVTLSVIVCGLVVVDFEGRSLRIKAPPAVSMNSSPPAASPQIIKATEFIVVDSHGNQLASLGQSYEDPNYAQLSFVFHLFTKDENQGFANTDNVGSSLTLSDLGLNFNDYEGNSFAWFVPEGTTEGPPEGLSPGNAVTQPMLTAIEVDYAGFNHDLTVGDITKDKNWVDIDNDSVSVWQPADENGDGALQRAVLGVAQLVDTKRGDQTTTAPSRLTLFDAKGNMIWHDPYP